MINKMIYFRFQRLILYGVIVIMAIQLIYYYSNLGYAHVILYILFLLNVDIYKTEYRNVKTETIVTLLFIVTTIVLIFTHIFGDITGYLYYPLIVIISLVNIRFTLQFRNVIVKKELHKVNERNIKMLQKNNKFISIYSYIISLILLGFIVQSIYSIITL